VRWDGVQMRVLKASQWGSSGRLIVAVVLSISLTGCGLDEEADVAANSLNESIPRAAPEAIVNCTGTTADGNAANTLASVKIIDYDGTKLFVPNAWIRGYFDDGRSEADAGFRSIVSNAITPAINSAECPGIVHKFKVGERASRHGAMAFRIKGPMPLSPLEKASNAGSIVQIFVGARRREDVGKPMWPDEDVSSAATGWVRLRQAPIYKLHLGVSDQANGCTARYDSVDSVWLLYQWVDPAIGLGLVVQSDAAEPDPAWRQLCGKIRPLLAWLTTPPTKRAITFITEK
jgi:hypothetical protein